jgi:hypothetical protein
LSESGEIQSGWLVKLGPMLTDLERYTQNC